MLDAGNLLFPEQVISPQARSQAEATAMAITRAFTASTGAITGIGPYDLAAGLSFFAKTAAKQKDNYVCANLIERQSNAPFFKPYVFRSIGKLRVAVIGLAHLTDPAKKEIVEKPWQEVLPPLLSRIRGADMTILLSSYDEEENKKIARGSDAIHILFQAGTPARKKPTLINNTLLCRTPTKGQFQGLLTVHWDSSGKWKEDAEDEKAKARAASEGSTFSHRLIPLSAGVGKDKKTEMLLKSR